MNVLALLRRTRSWADRSVTRPTIPLVAFAYGLTIANLYYCQPLLPQMSRSFAAGSATALLPALGQIGYLVGLVLVVPLGDIVRRRRLICALLCLDAAALLATATAPDVTVALAAGTMIGLTSASVVNVLVSYAAGLVDDHHRGRAVVTVLSSGMTGVLLSRTVAGLIAELTDWRTVFLLAAATTVTLSGVLARAMAPEPAELTIGYRNQLQITIQLACHEPVLRHRALIGGCVFAASMAFWATVAFLLAGPPYNYSASAIGLFGLFGATGILSSKLIGHIADRGWQQPATGVLLTAGMASFIVLGVAGHHLGWLIAGILILDVAVRGTHLLNASVVYRLTEHARSRLASTYMTVYTFGGILGAAVGAAGYRESGWAAVSATGAIAMTIGLGIWARQLRRAPRPVTSR